jgi:hypothetical protein
MHILLYDQRNHVSNVHVTSLGTLLNLYKYDLHALVYKYDTL